MFWIVSLSLAPKDRGSIEKLLFAFFSYFDSSSLAKSNPKYEYLPVSLKESTGLKGDLSISNDLTDFIFYFNHVYRLVKCL